MEVHLLKDETDVDQFVDRIGGGPLVREELCSALEQAWMFERALFVNYRGDSFQWMQVRERHLKNPSMMRAIHRNENMWPLASDCFGG